MKNMQVFGLRILRHARMPKFVTAAIVVALTLSLCAAASGQMVLYDSLRTGVINPDKWVGAPGDPDIREAVRQSLVVMSSSNNVGLHLMQKAYSATTDDNGSSGGLFGLSFPNPSAVTAISFTLVVNQIGVVDCSTNPGVGVTSAEFRGTFFNIDPSATTSAHDVVANISIERSLQESGPTVVGFVQEGSGIVLGYQVLGTLALGSTNRLFVQWDQPNHRFVFQLNNGAQVSEPYNVSDTTPPFYAFKNIDLARVVPHCTSTPRPYATVDAYFRDVYVNP